jgi:hypothetical protein
MPPDDVELLPVGCIVDGDGAPVITPRTATTTRSKPWSFSPADSFALPRTRILPLDQALIARTAAVVRQRSREHRPRATRRIARAGGGGSRGDPPLDDPDLEPPLRVISPAEIRRAVERALGSAA